MALPTRITLPPSGRPVGGLLSAARPIGGDWWRGVTFASGQCLVPQVVGTCTDGDTTKVANHLSDAQSFDAFGVVMALECTTMGRTGVVEYANQSLDVVREFAVAREFLTGDASANPALVDATIPLAPGASPTAALACLDQYAGEALSGRSAFFHVAPVIATHLFADGAIYKDGRLWYTPSGNIVVISPGYDGRVPSAGTPGDELYIYATGEVYAEVGQRESLLAVERGQNTLQGIAEDAALAVFDPCFVVAIDSGLTACAVVS